jgi:HEAT repeat protein
MDAQRLHTIHVSRDAPPVVREAAYKLDSMDAAEREAALTSLAQINDPAGVEVLAEALRHPIRDVRFAAAIELGNRGDVRALETLFEAARYEERMERRRVQPFIMSRMGAAAVPKLIAALRDEDHHVQQLVIGALGQIGGSSALAALIACLRNQGLNRYLRSYAASALGEAHDAAAVPALTEAMSDPEPAVRTSVAAALPRCGGSSVIPSLVQLLKDPDSGVRHTAIYSLVDVGDASAVPALVSALSDSYHQVIYGAAKALEKIGDPSAIPGLLRAVVAGGGGSVERAFTSFGSAVLPELRCALHHKDPRMRTTAISLLASLGDQSDLPAFLGAFRDESPIVRKCAIRALKKEWQTPEIVQLVIERLQDEDEGVCIQAAYKLGDLGDASAVHHLIPCLEDDGVAEAAAGALEAIGTRPAKNAVRAWRKEQRQ